MSAIAIVDSHVHFWDPARFNYPWLAQIPALHRAFFPRDLEAKESCKMIFVESGCEPEQSLAEVDWVSTLAENDPRLKGIVAHASLEKGRAIREDLVALSDRPLVKGVRRLLQNDVGFCGKPETFEGLKQLAEFGFTFDACIRQDQLPELTELARRVPEVIFVLDHCGKPAVRSAKREPWAANLKLLAALPNVVCKISGLTTEADLEKGQTAELKFYLEHALNCFGFDRLLFGGDWPVATLATSYERWLQSVREIFSSFGDKSLRKLFQTNAERIYRV